MHTFVSMFTLNSSQKCYMLGFNSFLGCVVYDFIYIAITDIKYKSFEKYPLWSL